MSKFKERFNKWKEIKTLKELIFAIPVEIVEKLVVLLFIFVSFLPIITIIHSHIEEKLKSITNVGFTWYFDLLQLSLLGIILLIYYFLRALYLKKNSFLIWIKKNLLPMCLLGMLVWSIFSTFLSSDIVISLRGDTYRHDGLITYFAYAVFFILAINIRNNKNIRIIIEAVVASSALLAMCVTLRIPSIMQFFMMVQDRAMFFNSNHYGYFICLTLMGAVYLVMTKPEINIKYKNAFLLIHVLELILITNSLMLCMSLGPLLAVLIALVFVTGFVVVKDKNNYKKMLIIDGVILLILLFFNTSEWNLIEDFSLMFSDMGSLVSSESIDAIGTGRGRLWKHGIEFALQKPLFGYGPENLGEQYWNLEIYIDRPHNELIQFAASLGIPVLIFYLTGLMSHLVEFVKKFKQLSMTTVWLFTMVGCYLISSFFGNTMFYTTPYFFIVLGLSYAAIKQE